MGIAHLYKNINPCGFRDTEKKDRKKCCSNCKNLIDEDSEHYFSCEILGIRNGIGLFDISEIICEKYEKE